MMTKEIVADYAKRLAAIPVLLHKYIDPVPTTTFEQRFFIYLLRRQTTLLLDFADILRKHKSKHLGTAFIIARCLLDDFITILYLDLRGFTEEDINCHSGLAFRNRFDTMKEEQLINDKYFGGNDPHITTKAQYEKHWNAFKNHPPHERFFKKNGKHSISDTLKSFPKPSAIMRELPKTEVGRANAHAFTLWKLFSNHIHYSAMTNFFDREPEARDTEINMLADMLSFVVKTIGGCSEALNKFGIPNELEDPTNVVGVIRGE